MTIEQIYLCAEELRDDADTANGCARINKGQLDELKDKYDDLSRMTETDKRLAESYEEWIKKYHKIETAARTMEQLLKNIDVRFDFHVRGVCRFD